MKKSAAVIIIIVLILILHHIGVSIHNLIQNEDTIYELRESYDAEKQTNKYLSERLSYVKSDKFVEKEAREKLGLMQESEYPVFVIPPSSQSESTYEEEIANWKKWKNIFKL